MERAGQGANRIFESCIREGKGLPDFTHTDAWQVSLGLRGEIQDALTMAVKERDRELVADGREAVGVAVGLPKRQAGKSHGPKDDLDSLVDGLDELGI